MVNNKLELLSYIKFFYSDLASKKTTLTLRSNNAKIQQLDIFKDVLEKTSNEYSTKARCYLYILEQHHSVCESENCQISTKFDNEKNEFRDFCSITCRNKSSKMREQISKTWTEEKKKIKNERTVKTNIAKYGATNPMKNKEILEKVKQTCIIKYGGNSSTYKHMTNLSNYNKQYVVDNFIEGKCFNYAGFQKYFNISSSNINKRLEYLNVQYTWSTHGSSSQEKELQRFLEDNNITYIKNSRSIIQGELDLFLPDYNIAIEFNGLYYHSYGSNNMNSKQSDLYYQKNRHIKKTEQCEQKGIKLFHIFENEWIEKKEIWKSIILNSVNKSEKIFARKCYIKEVDFSSTKEFLNNNHIQGSCQSSIRYGLYYNNELVSIMTFGKLRYSKQENTYELIRFCNKKYCTITGAASKLLKYFRTNYPNVKIQSFANRRWSSTLSNLYCTLGFELTHSTNPNYFYIKSNKLFSRLIFQKHKLKKLLTTFDESKTEIQNMIDNKYRIIYDSGNLTYIIK